MAKKKYALILGTRPEFIKAAALFHAMPRYPEIELMVIHTGQHFDRNMSDIFFTELQLPRPDISLVVEGEKHSERLGKMITSLKKALDPITKTLSGIIVIGDVNSVLAGGLAAAYVGIPVIHIESGLRSHDPRMPEELNRVIVDHISDKLFTTEESGTENLLHEGIEKKKIHFVGNIGIESLELFRDKIDAVNMPEKFGLEKGKYLLATIHRVEHTSDPKILGRIFSVLGELGQKTDIILPLHPATRKRLDEYGLSHLLTMKIIEPLSYFEFMSLVMNSKGVLTDSGGIQEETSHLGIPCCTLRDNTERPVTVTHGSNKLFPSATLNSASIFEIESHLNRTDFKANSIPLWDKHVSERIYSLL